MITTMPTDQNGPPPQVEVITSNSGYAACPVKTGCGPPNLQIVKTYPSGEHRLVSRAELVKTRRMTEHTPIPISPISRVEVIATGARRRWTLAENKMQRLAKPGIATRHKFPNN